MWCPEGYVTLSEIDSWFMWDSDLVGPAEDRPRPEGLFIDTGTMDNIETEGFSNWIHSAFIECFREDIRACLPSGILVRLAPPAFSSYDPSYLTIGRDYIGPFPSQYAERVRLSKRIFHAIDPVAGRVRSDWPRTLVNLNALDGAPLCIQDAKLPVRLDGLTKWLLDEMPRRAAQAAAGKATEPSSNATQIADAFRNRKVRTKPEARQMFGRNMKHEAWQALWREACEIMPELARPGPR